MRIAQDRLEVAGMWSQPRSFRPEHDAGKQEQHDVGHPQTACDITQDRARGENDPGRKQHVFGADFRNSFHVNSLTLSLGFVPKSA